MIDLDRIDLDDDDPAGMCAAYIRARQRVQDLSDGLEAMLRKDRARLLGVRLDSDLARFALQRVFWERAEMGVRFLSIAPGGGPTGPVHELRRNGRGPLCLAGEGRAGMVVRDLVFASRSDAKACPACQVERAKGAR
ncbi:MAG: hypothetical protein KC656_03865 [Myxococcales bacterium]|nr:hypothetical protein [Myxococcales bacterium]